MSLLKCPDCGTEVSDKAFTCPKCGRVLKKAKRTIFGKIVLLTFWLYELLTISIIFSGSFADFFWGVILWFVGTLFLGILTLLTKPSK